jgi:hypothetical protein
VLVVLVLVAEVLVVLVEEVPVLVGAGDAPDLGRYLMPLELHEPCSGASMGLGRGERLATNKKKGSRHTSTGRR